jgi:phosphoribosylanthranilate isomerase
MPVDVKICGLSTPETLEAAIAAGAAMVGLNFFPKSPRYVSVAKAAELAKLARGRTKIVAVTVDADDALIMAIESAVAPDLYQAHGGETPERIAQIGAMTGTPVMKAISVKDGADVIAARSFDGTAALILYDAKAPETLKDALPGGNGVPFDWSLLGGPANPGVFVLSGGLNPANVAHAIRVTGAPVVDVSSGVETAPGIKDSGLIRKFIEAAKAAG